jgi:SAM-dependent methyltransferase
MGDCAPQAVCLGTEMNLEACPGCGFQEFDHKPSAFPGFRLSCCRQCGTAWTSPRPSPEELELYYRSDYYGPENDKFVKPMEMAVEWMNRARARQLHRLLQAPGRVLEIGCGRGLLLYQLARLGHECYGIERSSLAAARARRIAALQVFTRSLEDCRFADCSFDLVVLWHVLEHLENPNDVLKEVHRVLKPGGALVLEVPNFSSLQAQLFGKKWFHLDIPRHLVHYSRNGILQLLNSRQFAVQQVSTMSLEQAPFGALQSLLNCLNFPPETLYKILKREIQVPIMTKGLHMGLAAVLILPSFVFSVVETLFGKGAVLRVFARRLA